VAALLWRSRGPLNISGVGDKEDRDTYRNNGWIGRKVRNMTMRLDDVILII